MCVSVGRCVFFRLKGTCTDFTDKIQVIMGSTTQPAKSFIISVWIWTSFHKSEKSHLSLGLESKNLFKKKQKNNNTKLHYKLGASSLKDVGIYQAVSVRQKHRKFTCMSMFSPQLCSVHTCVLIWSLPTRRSTRAPPWEQSPPPPSLSTWTTKQRRGKVPACFYYIMTLWVDLGVD